MRKMNDNFLSRASRTAIWARPRTNSLKSTSPLKSESKTSTTRFTNGFSFNSGTDKNSPTLIDPEWSKSNFWKRFSSRATSSAENPSTLGRDVPFPIFLNFNTHYANPQAQIQIYRLVIISVKNSKYSFCSSQGISGIYLAKLFFQLFCLFDNASG